MENTVRYEVLILTSPEITQDEGKELETQFDKIIQSHKGSVVSFERWGKYKLAYPVRKNTYGVYFLSRFAIAQKDQSLIEQVKNLFAIKLENIVMRTVITALDQNQSLEYQRPRSLEETPPREEGGYVRERRPDRAFTNSVQDDISLESDDELQSEID
jgi:small subunit ribosomal protein S6